eukprot:EG_transcript_57996
MPIKVLELAVAAAIASDTGNVSQALPLLLDLNRRAEDRPCPTSPSPAARRVLRFLLQRLLQRQSGGGPGPKPRLPQLPFISGDAFLLIAHHRFEKGADIKAHNGSGAEGDL